MRVSVRGLRVWLVAGVVLLVLVIGGFLGYARYRTHRFLAGLPAKLGVDIRRETNGYTYSQSVKGKTVMTLHAAKAVEHTGGKVTLHDVGMVLYGRKQDRADRISGAEFEYDTATGVVRAVGEVHIDLQAPAAAGAHGGGEAMEESARVIHVKTSGLVYLQKLSVAATDQELEFQFGGVTGHALGAEYNADTGVLVLESAVKANGLDQGRPVVLTASHAELHRTEQQALLTEARYVSPGQTARSDHAVVHLRADGMPERMEADGHVVVEGAAGGQVTAPHAEVLLSREGKARSAHLFGGVGFQEVERLREGKGQALDARIGFDAAGRAQQVLLAGSVAVEERVRTVESAAWSERKATGGRMSFALGGDGSQRVLRGAEILDAARVTLLGDTGPAGTATSEMAGDVLRGVFTGTGRAARLTELHGTGHTFLRRLTAAGAEQTGHGDRLDVALRQAGRAGRAGSEDVARAEQAGHVVLTGRAARRAGGPVPSTSRAVAELAVYEGDTERLTLTGHPEVVDDGSTVAAERIVLEQGSGDARAEGAVKASYIQAGGSQTTSNAARQEPVHVLAERAELRHDAGRALFYGGAGGGAGRPARMWQGGSQVEAPVLEMEQAQRRLTARGGGGDGDAPVHAVLVSSGAGKKESRPGGQAAVVRVASRQMVYSEDSRQVEFTEGVRVEDADGVLAARQATAFLRAASVDPVGSGGGDGASKGDREMDAAGLVFPGGGVERIVARGRVEMEQPGRRASGERLVYTAGDGMFVLTGTAGAPPRLIDEAQGTVTGASLRFHAGDDRVTVVGDAGGQRARTVTRVKQR